MPTPQQFAHGLDVPLKADFVDSPVVQYGGGLTAIHFTTDEGRWGRVTFERLDSIKICRGEYHPFPPAPTDGRLLGEYTLDHGTGVAEKWYDDGSPAAEVPLLKGMPTGRQKTWYEDGVPVPDRYRIRGQK